jgi:hypothetical protein
MNLMLTLTISVMKEICLIAVLFFSKGTSSRAMERLHDVFKFLLPVIKGQRKTHPPPSLSQVLFLSHYFKMVGVNKMSEILIRGWKILVMTRV